MTATKSKMTSKRVAELRQKIFMTATEKGSMVSFTFGYKKDNIEPCVLLPGDNLDFTGNNTTTYIMVRSRMVGRKVRIGRGRKAHTIVKQEWSGYDEEFWMACGVTSRPSWTEYPGNYRDCIECTRALAKEKP